MSNNKFIEEDWERLSEREIAYIQAEKQKLMEDDWWQWETEQMDKERKPAKIEIIMPKIQEDEAPHITKSI